MLQLRWKGWLSEVLKAEIKVILNVHTFKLIYCYLYLWCNMRALIKLFTRHLFYLLAIFKIYCLHNIAYSTVLFWFFLFFLFFFVWGCIIIPARCRWKHCFCDMFMFCVGLPLGFFGSCLQNMFRCGKKWNGINRAIDPAPGAWFITNFIS